MASFTITAQMVTLANTIGLQGIQAGKTLGTLREPLRQWSEGLSFSHRADQMLWQQLNDFVDGNPCSRADASKLLKNLAGLDRGQGFRVKPIRRIFVPNRGEPVMRLITAARTLGAERGEKVEVVVMYLEQDKNAPWVKEADIAIPIPPKRQKLVPVLDDDGNPVMVEDKETKELKPKMKRLIPYLDLELILQVIKETDADSVWPGWGFMSEKEELSAGVTDLGKTFIGPSQEAMRAVGDKIGFKRLADPENRTWSGGAVATVEEAQAVCARLGYPCVIKATAGGGGRGIKFVNNDAEVVEKFPVAQREAGRAFGDATLFVERAVLGARHIEIQMIADQYGHVVAVGARDCSVQRNNQKLVEEAPPPGISERQLKKMYRLAEKIVREAGYVGVGTVEGLFKDGEFQPMELNARLQVEHTVTEVVTGTDLVQEMICVAEGHPLSFLETPAVHGHAIEVRVNFEDPDKDFAPTAGRLHVFRPPTGPGIRFDSGVREGDEIGSDFDPMGAKLIAWGRTRSESIARTRGAIGDFDVDGVATSVGLAGEVVAHPDFVQGGISTQWFPAYMRKRKAWEVKPYNLEGLMIAAVLAYRGEAESYQAAVLGDLKKGLLPSLPPRPENNFLLSLYEREYSLSVRQVRLGNYVVSVGGRDFEVQVEERGRSEYRMVVDGRPLKVIGSEQEGTFGLTLEEGVAIAVKRPPVGAIKSPSNGSIPKILVKLGQKVAVGDDIVLFEQMKGETPLKAEVAGEVEEIFIREGDAVEKGKLLVRINTDLGEKKPPEAPALVFRPRHQGIFFDLTRIRREVDQRVVQAALHAIAPSCQQHYSDGIQLLEQALLGFDSLGLFTQMVNQLGVTVGELSPFLDRMLQVFSMGEGLSGDQFSETAASLLESFIDVELLFQKGLRPSLREKSVADLLDQFLKTRQSPSKEFEELLLRALRHYGVTSLQSSVALDRALLRIVIAREERDLRQRLIIKFLDWLAEVGKKREGTLNGRLMSVLERYELPDREVYPVIHAAQGVLFTLQQGKISRNNRAEANRRVDDLITQALSEPEGSESRREAIRSIAALPAVTANPLLTHFGGADQPRAELAASALLVRFYGSPHPRRRHQIVDHKLVSDVQGPVSVGRFRDGKSKVLRGTVRIIGGAQPLSGKDITNLVRRGLNHLEGLTQTRGRTASDSAEPIMDCTLEVALPALDGSFDKSEPNNLAGLIAALPDVIGYVSPSLSIKRIIFAVMGVSGGEEVAYLIFERSNETPSRFVEDPLRRFLHPYRAEEIELWRLARHWDVAKIDTAWAWNHLFIATEKGDDPGKPGDGKKKDPDRRLFAYSVVPHLSSPARDSQGNLFFSEIDVAMGQAIHAIYDALQNDERAKGAASHRINLIIRPEMTASVQDLQGAVNRLYPRIRGRAIGETSIRLHRWRPSEDQPYRDVVIRARRVGDSGQVQLEVIEPAPPPSGYITPMTAHQRRVLRNHRSGYLDPYEYRDMLVAAGPYGEATFQEFDISHEKVVVDGLGRDNIQYELDQRVDRPAGQNSAKVVFGLLRRPTKNHPEGIEVMQIINDPSIGLCPLEGPECARIMAAINYAERQGLEVDWLTTSSGAGISMTKGTENLDWTARVMRRIGEFVRRGGRINVIAQKTNIGAQSYWMANATMMLDSGGVLISTPDSFTALTGNEAQKISGSVPAEDNVGLAGAERITGPNGETQFLVGSIVEATELLWRRHDLLARPSGEVLASIRQSGDPKDRDITAFVYGEKPDKSPLTLADVFADKDRKTAYPVEALMSAVHDQDGPVFERWSSWSRDGSDLVKVHETRIGGIPSMLIGVEARPMPREGEIPPGYPAQWSGSTLFPEGSKKMARAINAASGNMDLVILANLSGFDGSPESLAKCQLEWGTAIEEAVRTFQGKLVFVVVTRYHGGAYVVFSRVLNHRMTVAAVEGAFASVIGGAIAVKVVFKGEVKKEVSRLLREDATVRMELSAARSEEERVEIEKRVRAEVERKLRNKYDGFHTVERARDVGSVEVIVPAKGLRPWIIEELRSGREAYRAELTAELECARQIVAAVRGATISGGLALLEGALGASHLGRHLHRFVDPLEQGTALTAAPVPAIRATGSPAVDLRVESGASSLTDDQQQFAATLGQDLRVKMIGDRTVLSYSSVETTMDVAQALAKQGWNPGSVVVAETQTKGRGRPGKSWFSSAGQVLCLSLDLPTTLPADQHYKLGFAAALAVANVVDELGSDVAQIKWPNDVYLKGKKLAGLLVETVGDGRVVLGLGLNTNAERFEGELADTAVSLRMTTRTSWPHEEILKKLFPKIAEVLAQLEQGDWMDVLQGVRSRFYLRDTRVQVTHGDDIVQGVVRDMTGEGLLVLQTDDGDLRRFASGEVTVVRKL